MSVIDIVHMDVEISQQSVRVEKCVRRAVIHKVIVWFVRWWTAAIPMVGVDQAGWIQKTPVRVLWNIIVRLPPQLKPATLHLNYSLTEATLQLRLQPN